MGELEVTVTVRYRGSEATRMVEACSGNPLYAVLEAEQAIRSAGLDVSAMLAGVWGDVRVMDDPPAEILVWPLQGVVGNGK